jgi:predicted dinucleotide-binding enzyme
MEKKDYIIVDENNNWLTTSRQITEDELKAEANELIENQMGEHVMIFAYETIGEPIEF